MTEVGEPLNIRWFYEKDNFDDQFYRSEKLSQSEA